MQQSYLLLLSKEHLLILKLIVWRDIKLMSITQRLTSMLCAFGLCGDALKLVGRNSMLTAHHMGGHCWQQSPKAGWN